MRITYTLILYFLTTFSLLSQYEKMGSAPIINHSKETYNAGTQNWGGISLNNGISFFANNSGLLEYDGINWKLHLLPKRSIVRSICYSNSERIYIGGQDEVGYFAPDDQGNLIYTSIRENIPNRFLPIEDVWDITSKGDKIYFRSVNKVYTYIEDDGFEINNPGNPIITLDQVKDKIIYHDLEQGLVELDKTPFPWSEAFISRPVIKVVSYGENGYLIITEKDGIYKYENGNLSIFNTAYNDFLIENRLSTILRLDNGGFAIGTQFGGILLVDKEGMPLELIDKNNGLQNNNINAMHQDQFGSLWVSTSNGIDQVLISDPSRIIHPDGETQATIYDIQTIDDHVFFATNNGLYRSALTPSSDVFKQVLFEKIKNTDGECWGLDLIDDQLLLGHNTGGYVINGLEAINFTPPLGTWKFVQSHHPEYIYVGTYSGIFIYKRSNNTWQLFKKLEGFVESARIMISTNKNELWVSHPYRGVYRIDHDDEFMTTKVVLYDENKGLPSILQNYIFNVNGIPYVTGETGIYRYEINKDAFVKDSVLSSFFDPEENIRRLYHEINGNIWFISEKKTGKLVPDDRGNYQITLIPDLEGVFVGGFENLYITDSTDLLACTDRGIIYYNLNLLHNQDPPKAFFRTIQLLNKKDSILYGGHGKIHKQPFELTHEQNAILITYGSSDHSGKSVYRYRLKELNDEWSQWSFNYTKEINNLRQGKYTFEIQVKNGQNLVSETAQFSFNISPPWHQSLLAYFLYMMLTIMGLLSLYFIPNKKYQKEKAILSEAKQKTDQELRKVRMDKLKAEIEHKNKELASSTMHLLQKNETLHQIKQELESAINKVQSPTAIKELKKTLSHLSDDERLEEDWEKFSVHFDQVHSDFLKRLKETYPTLSPKDQKMAAYLRMNLSTKEIAPLLNISVRGVEIGRYRLRKKLNLESQENLTEFMISF